MNQQFQRGDLVRIAKDLGPHMRHFTADCNAIVVGSYADQYGGTEEHNRHSYTLHLEGGGKTSWYYSSQLTLIERNRADLLDQWQAAKDAEAKQKGDIDWIFANGKEVVSKTHSASVAALAKCFGLDNLWGSHGEGITYMENSLVTLRLATPFLLAGDKAGWLDYCNNILRGRAQSKTEEA